MKKLFFMVSFLQNLEKMLKGKYSNVMSFVITSVIFGGYHIQLGSSGVINATIVGAIYLFIVSALQTEFMVFYILSWFL